MLLTSGCENEMEIFFGCFFAFFFCMKIYFFSPQGLVFFNNSEGGGGGVDPSNKFTPPPQIYHLKRYPPLKRSKNNPSPKILYPAKIRSPPPRSVKNFDHPPSPRSVKDPNSLIRGCVTLECQIIGGRLVLILWTNFRDFKSI